MKTAYTLAFFVYLISLIFIIKISLTKPTSKENLQVQVYPINEHYQDSIEQEVAIPQKTLLMYDAVYDASQIK